MLLTKSLRKLMLGAVAVLPALTLASTQARADVLADAILVLENFILAQDDQGTVFTDSEITILTATNFANTGGDGLGSVAGNLNQSGNNPINPPGDVNGDVNLTGISEGTSPIADDDYSAIIPPPTDHFAYADSDVNGVSIQIGANPAGVTAQTRATSGLLSSDVGDATSNTGLEASFDFIANVDGEMWVDFDFFAHALAFVDPTADITDASAIARISWNISLVDAAGNLVGELNPTELNTSRSRNEVSDGTAAYDNSGHLTLFLGALVAGQEYNITITHESFADTLLQVAEPATLLLFGSGLIALAFVGYRHGRRRSESLPAA